MTDRSDSESKDKEEHHEIITSKNITQNSSLTNLPNRYKALLICYIALPFSFMYGPLAMVASICLLVLSISIFVSGIRTFMQIKAGNANLPDNGFVVPAMITPVLLMLSLLFMSVGVADAINRSMLMHYPHEIQQLGDSLTDEDSGVIPESDITKPFYTGSAIVLVVFVWILVRFRKYAKKYWTFSLGLGILSAGVGMLLGAMSEDFYVLRDGKNIGWIIGGIAGLMVGISYVLVLAKHHENKKAEVSIVGYGTLSGMIAGAICSTIVHAFLMIRYEETHLYYMLAGLGFGIFAGTILGWISSGVVSKFYYPDQAKQIMVTPEEGSGSHER